MDREKLGYPSDYCFSGVCERIVENVEELRLSAEPRKMILGGTAAKLLKILPYGV